MNKGDFWLPVSGAVCLRLKPGIDIFCFEEDAAFNELLL